MSSRFETTDLFRGALFMCMGGDLEGIRFVELLDRVDFRKAVRRLAGNPMMISLGRSCSFTHYPSGDLKTVTDPAGKTWTCVYDGNHRLISFMDPLSVTTVTNTYDTLGRVMRQVLPRQTGTAAYAYFFAGYRSCEEDPDGNHACCVKNLL
ncbi:MAG: hypothetical protein V1793_13995 [Pseudomonadota bacterium]